MANQIMSALATAEKTPTQICHYLGMLAPFPPDSFKWPECGTAHHFLQGSNGETIKIKSREVKYH